MLNGTFSSYISLFNTDSNNIQSLPNSVIISDNNNEITSSRNIDGNIDPNSIDVNKIKATGPLDASHVLYGNGT